MIGFTSNNGKAAVLGVALVQMLSVLTLSAANILVPNGSFESQSGVGQPFGVNVLIDSWQKPPNPGYPEGGENNFYWIQSAGAFVGTFPNTANPYSNLHGTQAAYVLSLPGAGLFQDSQSTDWNGASGLNATFQTGLSYELTVGVFGKGMVNNYSTLELSLYYRDNSNAKVTIGTPTTITFNTTTFNPAAPFSLIDYSVGIPAVEGTDAWAGKNIGIQISSVLGDGNGYWDMDNVRLVAVPEPGTLGLAALGLGGLLIARRYSRRHT